MDQCKTQPKESASKTVDEAKEAEDQTVDEAKEAEDQAVDEAKKAANTTVDQAKEAEEQEYSHVIMNDWSLKKPWLAKTDEML